MSVIYMQLHVTLCGFSCIHFSRRLFSQWMQLWHFKLVWITWNDCARAIRNIRLPLTSKVSSESGPSISRDETQCIQSRCYFSPCLVTNIWSMNCIFCVCTSRENTKAMLASVRLGPLVLRERRVQGAAGDRKASRARRDLQERGGWTDNADQ